MSAEHRAMKKLAQAVSSLSPGGRESVLRWFDSRNLSRRLADHDIALALQAFFRWLNPSFVVKCYECRSTWTAIAPWQASEECPTCGALAGAES